MEAECGESPATEWSGQQTAALLLSMRTVTDTLHKHQQNGRRTRHGRVLVGALVLLVRTCFTLGVRTFCQLLSGSR